MEDVPLFQEWLKRVGLILQQRLNLCEGLFKFAVRAKQRDELRANASRRFRGHFGEGRVCGSSIEDRLELFARLVVQTEVLARLRLKHESAEVNLLAGGELLQHFGCRFAGRCFGQLRVVDAALFLTLFRRQ